MFVFLGFHFTAFGVLECSKCLYHKDTKFELCFIYFLYNDSKFSLVKKSGMSSSPAVMYSVCQPDNSETSKSEPVYALHGIIPSEHTQQRI